MIVSSYLQAMETTGLPWQPSGRRRKQTKSYLSQTNTHNFNNQQLGVRKKKKRQRLFQQLNQHLTDTAWNLTVDYTNPARSNPMLTIEFHYRRKVLLIKGCWFYYHYILIFYYLYYLYLLQLLWSFIISIIYHNYLYLLFDLLLLFEGIKMVEGYL